MNPDKKFSYFSIKAYIVHKSASNEYPWSFHEKIRKNIKSF